MGRNDAFDWLATILVALAAAVSLANGLWMLWAPIAWYGGVPGVALTGPPNAHFIRDIGVAFVVSGAVLGIAARDVRTRWLAVLGGSTWLAGHAGVHVYEFASGICAPGQFWRDAPGVLGPPLLALTGVAIPIMRARIAPMGLPAGIAIPAIERSSQEPDSYVRQLRHSPGATGKFLGFMTAAMHRHAAPAELYHAARIGSMLTEDCGGCALAAGRAALADGVLRATVNALLRGVPEGEAMTRAFNFGTAVGQPNAEAGTLGTEIAGAHGEAVRVELAMAAALVRGFSGTRRGLGFAESCALHQLEV